MNAETLARRLAGIIEEAGATGELAHTHDAEQMRSWIADELAYLLGDQEEGFDRAMFFDACNVTVNA